jgi:phosphoglucomutase
VPTASSSRRRTIRRPSGSGDVYKIYAESSSGPEHLKTIQKEAQDIVSSAIGG